MTTKKFLISWLRYIILLCVLIASHVAFWELGAVPIAKLLAPKFTPLTAIEEDQFKASYTKHKKEQMAAALEKCEGRPKENGSISLYGFDNCVNLHTFSHILHPEEIHAREEIYPIVEKIRDLYHLWLFGIFYAIIAVLMSIPLWKWMVETAIPGIKNRAGGLRIKLNDESILWSNRKLSTAVRQLDDLENLYKRGMITSEVLQERKADIKKALSQ